MTDPTRRRRAAAKLRAAQRPSSAIRIVVADNQAIDRAGMVGLLDAEPDFEVVGEASSVDEAIQQCRSLTPDLLILALNISGNTDTPALPVVRTKLPDLKVLAISERGAANCLVLNPPGTAHMPEHLRHLLCNEGWDCLHLAASQGAMGTLRRSADPEELFRAVRAVGGGHAWYDPTTAQKIMNFANPGAGNGGKGDPLTDREREVAALIAAGRSNKEIANDLKISEPTVKKHVGKVLEKLGTQDRLQAGLRIVRNPMILRRDAS